MKGVSFMNNTKHFEFWPARLPKSLTVPKTTLFEDLEMTTRKYPDKVAMQYYGASYTYEEIYSEAQKLAGYLEHELGIQKQDKVLLFIQNSPQFLISFLLYYVFVLLLFPLIQ